MAEGLFSTIDQIATLAATETMTRDNMYIKDIILNATAAGNFVMTIGETDMTFTTASPMFMITIPINRRVNFVELTSGPTNAKAYVMLGSMGLQS